MIISKESLNVKHLIGNDKNIPMLNNVHVTFDGSVVAANSQSVIAVEPINKNIKQNIPLKNVLILKSLNITLSSIDELIRNIPKDNLFKGLLEYVSIHFNKKREHYFAIITDGHREQQIELNIFERGYIKFMDMFRLVFKSKRIHKIILNRKRLINLLTAIDKVCPDKTESSIVYIEFTVDNGMIIRSENHKTGQRCVGVMNSYKFENEQWLEPNKWEQKFYDPKVAIKKD